jgi:hypothetical protein
MVELYRQRKTPESLPELSVYPASRIIWLQAEGTAKWIDKLGLAKYFYSYLQVIFYMP